MDATERYHIEVIGEDGEPLAPVAHAKKFKAQAGVIVRDNLDIRIREWHKQKDETIPFVEDRTKKMLWGKLMAHFTLPPEAPEAEEDREDAAEEDPEEDRTGEKIGKIEKKSPAVDF